MGKNLGKHVYQSSVLKVLTSVKPHLVLFFGAILVGQLSLAAIRCESVFSSSDAKSVFQPSEDSSSIGSQFLLSKDQNLHQSQMVSRVTDRLKRTNGQSLVKPVERVRAWIKYLDSLYDGVKENRFAQEKVKNIFYRQYVIRPTDVPDAYYEMQNRIARERGQGDQQFTISQRLEMAENLVIDQKKSLDIWSDYLLSKDTEMYPGWIKYWILTNVVKLSKYNPESGSFSNRSKTTVSPFPELNREALAYVVDSVLKVLKKEDLSEIKDEHWLGLLQGSQFSKLYGYAFKKLRGKQTERFHTNDGKWVLYKKGSSHLPLVESLQGHGTGWCTAGAATARNQLDGGDFYVYYSLDNEGRATAPRVAIRMSGDEIAEIRGVAGNQNLDPQINQSNIVREKLKEFGNKADNFIRKERDMRLLTAVESKDKLGQDLSKEDLIFLYELLEKITGFGYETDPRINEIKSRRNAQKDMDIALKDGLEFPETHSGDIDLSILTSAKGIKLPRIMSGRLILAGLKSAKGLVLPENFEGDLFLKGLESAEDLVLPKNYKRGTIYLTSLTSGKGLVFPEHTSYNIYLDSLISVDGLVFPKTMDGFMFVYSLKPSQVLQPPKMLNGGEIVWR